MNDIDRDVTDRFSSIRLQQRLMRNECLFILFSGNLSLGVVILVATKQNLRLKMPECMGNLKSMLPDPPDQFLLGGFFKFCLLYTSSKYKAPFFLGSIQE